MTFTRFLQISAFCLLGLSMAACSTSKTSYNTGGTQISDPFEGANRMTFAFNTAVDDAVIEPIIEGYRMITPKPARTGLRNFLRNLKSPITFANQVLQGDVSGAKNVVLRTSINTFVGAGGLFDVAGHEGIEYESEDFGQTLAVWGLGHGPYLVLPFIGPSTTRDYAGFIVDGVADPLNLYLSNTDRDGLLYTRVGLGYLDVRDSVHDLLRDLQANSFDYYAATRSAYYQRRAALVMDLESGTSSSSATSDFDDLY